MKMIKARVTPPRKARFRQAYASRERIMTQTTIIGLIVLAIGTLLLFFAWRASNAPVEQISEALTGRFTGNTMWYLVGGVIGIVAGGALLIRGLASA
ncbi:MAG: DUF3185 family protein [Roseovarius sp.]|nr:DUF3185 family protein [Roseovarius sp.]